MARAPDAGTIAPQSERRRGPPPIEASARPPQGERFMRSPARRVRARLRAVLLAALAVGIPSVYLPDLERFGVHALSPFPVSSSPVVLNNADRFLWVCNPDNDSVSVIDVGSDAAEK